MSSTAAASSIQVPRCTPGIGDVILKPDSDKLIDGIVAQPYALWPDDRGYFLEVLRVGQGPAGYFDSATTQVSAALSYPGTIKAFHYHIEQADFWVPAAGMLQVALVDLRPDSRTFGAKNTLYLGSLRPWQLLIPPGIGHGYKVIGRDPAVLVYVTSKIYNPADEGRIPYNEAGIAYDWEYQYK